MSFQDEMVTQGNWLFRWRSYLPLIFVIPLSFAVVNMRLPFGSYVLHERWEVVALGISILGVLVRVITVGHTPAGTSGRNTHGQVAETLNTTGIYSIVRHPLYLGNFLIGLGIVTVPLQVWLAALYVLAFWLYYERIVVAEEEFLRSRFGEAFAHWAQETPAFIPNLHLWKEPVLRFSIRNVLKREYTALALVVICHATIETMEHLVIDHEFRFELGWATLLGSSILLYLLLRILKRHSRLLHVEGR